MSSREWKQQWRRPTWSGIPGKVCAGGGVQVVQGFVGNDEEFEVDALRDWEPLEVTSDGS